MTDIIIKKSKIHGRGVFAAHDFKKGEVVVKYDRSKILTKEDVDKLPENEKKYASYLGEGKYILHQPPARYINHSCDANTYSDNFADVAKRDIKKGEEITADYVAEKVPGFDGMICKCGSKNCRSATKTSS